MSTGSTVADDTVELSSKARGLTTALFLGI